MSWVVVLWLLEDERSTQNVEQAKFCIPCRHNLYTAWMHKGRTFLSDCFCLECPHSLFQKEKGRKLDFFFSVWRIRAPQYRSKIWNELSKSFARIHSSMRNEKAGLERQHQFWQTCKGPWPLHLVLGTPSLKQNVDDGVQLKKAIIRNNRREKKKSMSATFCIWLLLDCCFQKWSAVASLGFLEGKGNFITDVNGSRMRLMLNAFL